MKRSEDMGRLLSEIQSEIENVDMPLEEVASHVGDEVELELMVTDEQSKLEIFEYGVRRGEEAAAKGLVCFLADLTEDSAWLVMSKDEDAGVEFLRKVLTYAHVLAVHAA